MSDQKQGMLLEDFFSHHVFALMLIAWFAVMGVYFMQQDIRDAFKDRSNRRPADCITACSPLPVREVRPSASRDDWCVCGEWR